jgi:tetratricopeptide (TPR) repeat protein
MRCAPLHTGLCCIAALLAFAIPFHAQQPSSAGQKVIQDPAEYKAYTAAVSSQDATARAAALDDFTQQYPHSVVLIDALQQEMAAWQAAGESSRVKNTARRLLAADSGNVRALGIVVALDRLSAAQGDAASFNEMCLQATGGMREVPMWQKPAGMTDADFAALSRLMNDIFIGAAGYCALQQKDYSQAQDWLTRALAIDPANVQDVFQLANADLDMHPLDANGFWYCARAIHLAQNAAITQDAGSMTNYCKTKYTAYHGGDDGWESIVAAVALEDSLPKDFAKSIKPAPAAAPKK